MARIVDSRSNKSNRSAENRRKFLNKVNSFIKKAIPKIVSNTNVKDLVTNDQDVKVPKHTLSEPSFVYQSGEKETYILPGNKEYVRGDIIHKPDEDEGEGKGGSNEDDGSTDNFVIRLTAEEFLNYFFDDLELPDLVKKSLLLSKSFERKNAGWQLDGPPGRLSVVRSLKTAYLRRLALIGPYKKELKELNDLEETNEDQNQRKDVLEKKIKAVPFIDTVDLRYRSYTKQMKPITTATVFSITDCSGSMGEREKTLSRKFFYLLYLFLIKKYEVVNLVWIIHTAEAREVTEQEFFENTESGGTVISTALSLVYDMIQEKYSPEDSNLYILQSSDGDNWPSDNPLVSENLDKLLPLIQFFGYIQIDNAEESYFTLKKVLEIYEEKMKKFNHLQAKVINGEKDIWPVFRSLFSKEGLSE